MNIDSMINVTGLLAKASSILEENGYRRVDDKIAAELGSASARLFEDDYGIVAIFVYETWQSLCSSWVDAQSSLVELMSKYITSNDNKAWEGYLVLLTPNPISMEDHLIMTKIRYDTARVRKLVATGDDIKVLADVILALLPLLPLQIESVVEFKTSALDLLPGLLAKKGVPEKTVTTVIKSFIEQRPLIENLHQYRGENENIGH